MMLLTRRLALGAAGALAMPGVLRAQDATTAIFELKDGPVTI